MSNRPNNPWFFATPFLISFIALAVIIALTYQS